MVGFIAIPASVAFRTAILGMITGGAVGLAAGTKWGKRYEYTTKNYYAPENVSGDQPYINTTALPQSDSSSSGTNWMDSITQMIPLIMMMVMMTKLS